MQGDPIRRGAGLALAALALGAIALELPRALPGESLMDFGSFVASGRAAREGLNPYGIYPLTLHVSLPGFEAWNPNLNPPLSALLFQAFDLVTPERSFRLWWAVSVACYAAAVALILRRYGREQPVLIGLWAAALAGFWDTLVLGQIYLPLVLAGVGAWLLLERGSRVWAGVLIGAVVALKPNFLVWPALLFLAGHRPPALVAVLTAGLLSALPLVAYGPEIYRQWIELVASDGSRGAFLTNASLAGLAARVQAAALGLAASAALLALAGLWALRRRPDRMQASAFGLVVALVASPLAWIHYTLFLLPVLASRWERPWARLVGAAFIVPVPFIIAQFGKPAWIQASVGSVYNWALLACLAMLVMEEFRERAPSKDGPAGAGVRIARP